MWQLSRFAVLGFLSLSFLCLLFFKAGLTWSVIVGSMADISSWPLVCLIVLTGTNLAFGTIKWILVIRALTPNDKRYPLFTEAMLVTTLGALIGQVMPVQLAIAFTRSLAGRLGVGSSPRVNLGTTVIEQLFDVVILCIAMIVTLLGLTLRPSPVGWTLLILLSVSIGVLVAIWLPLLLTALARFFDHLPSTCRVQVYASVFSSAVGRARELRPPVVMQLIALSGLRYVINLTRIAVVLSALGMPAYFVSAAIAFPLILLIALLPITPGNLGIMEWTWSSMLVSAGAAIEQSGLFAVTARISNILALTILIVFLLGLNFLRRTPVSWSLRGQ
jgi:uncharacterized protein (TIRG00374 family)